MKTQNFVRSVTILILGSLLLSCNRYTVSINDNQLYKPPTLISEVYVSDAALDTCIQQTVEDQAVTKLGNLKQLNCNNAGILSLAGLANYHRLTHISLRENRITDATELLKLSSLNWVDLSGNKNLSCDGILQLLNAGVSINHSNYDCK